LALGGKISSRPRPNSTTNVFDLQRNWARLVVNLPADWEVVEVDGFVDWLVRFGVAAEVAFGEGTVLLG
jgi:hypothetical protein